MKQPNNKSNNTANSPIADPTITRLDNLLPLLERLFDQLPDSVMPEVTYALQELRQLKCELQEHTANCDDEQLKLNTIINLLPVEIWHIDAQQNVTLINEAVPQALGLKRDDNLEKPLPDLLSQLTILDPEEQPRSPEQAPLLRSLRGDLITDEREIVLHPLTHEKLYRAANAAPVCRPDGEIIGAVAVVWDRSEQVKAEQRSATLENLITELAKASTVEQVAQVTLEHGLMHLSHSAALVAIRTDSTIEIVRQVGIPEDTFPKYRFIAVSDNNPLSNSIRMGRSIWIENTEAYRSQYPEAYNEIARPNQIAALIAVPLKAEFEILGAIMLMFNETIRITPSDRSFLTAVAQHCASALHRVYITEEVRLLTAQEERHRLARDLHDSVSQTLFSSSMIADVLAKTNKSDKFYPQLQRLYRLNRSALSEMQSLLLEMNPARFRTASLTDLLSQRADIIMGQTDLTVQLHIQGEINPPEHVRAALYRIAQEALNNIVKHANALHVDIYLESHDGQLTMRIVDNGQGFDPGTGRRGMGLSNMQERAEEIGASFNVQSAVGQGTNIIIQI